MLWIDGHIHTSMMTSFNMKDRGLLLADGLFETMPCFNGIAFMAEEHLDRMMRSATLIGMTLDRAVLEKAVNDLARVDSSTPGVIRLTATRGPGERGLALPDTPIPFVFASRTVWKSEIAFGTVQLATSAIRRNASSPLAAIKSLSYLDNILALNAAKQVGAEDALFLNHASHVTCTSMANLFILQGNSLMTPALSDGVLPGITRDLVLRLASRIGLDSVERSLTIDEVFRADAAFATNSVRFLTRISSLDNRPIGKTGDTRVTSLCDAIRRAVEEACHGYSL